MLLISLVAKMCLVTGAVWIHIYLLLPVAVDVLASNRASAMSIKPRPGCTLAGLNACVAISLPRRR
jgi:hypothetical protein